MQTCPNMATSWSSPRAWGCFRRSIVHIVNPAVFLTAVGVFPIRTTATAKGIRFLHARGGVSSTQSTRAPETKSSPPAWGCFLLRGTFSRGRRVFPTSVGVFLSVWSNAQDGQRLPHGCGGVSSTQSTRAPGTKSSPRLWGCFPHRHQLLYRRIVFPTAVGVFP